MNDCVLVSHYLFKRNEFPNIELLETIGFACVNAIYIFLN